MPKGVAGFSGERLRQVRQFRGIRSQRELANLLGMSPESVSRYERGDGSPTVEALSSIARALNVSPRFFLKEPPLATNVSVIFYRSLKSALQADRARAETLQDWTWEVDRFVSRYTTLPACTLPAMNRVGSVSRLADDMIEGTAKEARTILGVESGPLPNLVALLERQGVVIVKSYLADKELDGLSQWRDDRAFIQLNNTKSAARSRFDLAHELGHLLLHRYVDDIYERDRTMWSLLEAQAHRFASALLLPAEEFGNDVWTATLDEFVALKTKWQSSIQAMIRRSLDLGIIGDEEYRNLQKGLSYRRWRTEEPLEQDVRVETPTLLRQSMNLILERVPGGRDIVADALPFGAIPLGKITGLDPSAFEPDAPLRLVQLRTTG